MYDEINKRLLIVQNDKTVRIFSPETKSISDSLGTLTGNLYPISTSWEDEILIASSGTLQYFSEKNYPLIPRGLFC